MLQCWYANQTLQSWRGPYQGVGNISGSAWMPYQPWNVVSPPFPGYVSGHATFSGTTAEMFKLWRGGNDTMDWAFTFHAGTSVLEPRRVAGEPGYIANVTDVPNSGPRSVGYVPAQVRRPSALRGGSETRDNEARVLWIVGVCLS